MFAVYPIDAFDLYHIPESSIREEESEIDKTTNNSTIMEKFNTITERYDRILLTQFVGERNKRLKLFDDDEWSKKKEDTIPLKSSKDLAKKVIIKRLEKINNPPVEIKQHCGKGISQNIGVYVVMEEYYCSFEFMDKKYSYFDKSFWFCDRNGNELDVSDEKIKAWYQEPNLNQILKGWQTNLRDPLAKAYYLFFRFRDFDEIKENLLGNLLYS